MLSNVGNQPAGLSQVEIKGKTKYGSASWYIKSDFDKKLIEPAKAYIIKASNEGFTPMPQHISHEFRSFYRSQLGEPLKEECDLVIQYVQLNGVKEYLYHPFPCDVIDPTDDIKRPANLGK